ncbi:MAG: hypothetical protein ACXACC_01975 [Promethearchaeota archaeon]|jgi:hypothetical protein
MIEVYDYKYSKGKIAGYIEGTTYLDKKKRLKAQLEGNQFVADDQILLILREDGVITYSEGEEQGYIKDGRIYWINDELLYEFSKEEGKILDSSRNVVLKLEGNYEKLDDRDFFGIAGYFLELFA